MGEQINMKKLIPKHLAELFEISSCKYKVDDSYDTIGVLNCTCGCNKFLIFTEKWVQSPESKSAEKAINDLYDKYKKDPKYPIGNGNHFSQGNCPDQPHEKVYISYHAYGKESVILEDITELTKQFMSSENIPTLVLAVCTQCNREIEVFNSSKHGYDGLICENKVDYKAIRIKKIPKCKKCGQEERLLRIEFHYEDLEGVRNDLPNKDITNAFDWITIDLECTNCKNVQKGYLDLETM